MFRFAMRFKKKGKSTFARHESRVWLDKKKNEKNWTIWKLDKLHFLMIHFFLPSHRIGFNSFLFSVLSIIIYQRWISLESYNAVWNSIMEKKRVSEISKRIEEMKSFYWSERLLIAEEGFIVNLLMIVNKGKRFSKMHHGKKDDASMWVHF